MHAIRPRSLASSLGHRLFTAAGAPAVAAAALALAPAQPAAASQVLAQEPGRIAVELSPGDPLVVSLAVRVPALDEAPLDVFLLPDLSSSFSYGLSRLRSEAPGLVAGLQSAYPDVWLGVGSFVDKPIAPFGGATDYVYQTHLGVGTPGPALFSALAAPTVRWGRDLADAQLEALLHAALRGDGEIGFRAGARRIVVLATDGLPHQAADALALGFPPNDGDAEIDGTPPGTGEAYPELGQLREALLSEHVLPIFTVMGTTSLATYQDLVAQLGFGAATSLGSSGAGHLAAIEAGLAILGHALRPAVEDDVLDLVAAVDPPEHAQVAAGETRSFALTLVWDGTLPGDVDVGPLRVRTAAGDTTIEVSFAEAAPCANGLDDDGDGLVDMIDPTCSQAYAPSEFPPCADGVDNDGDGLVDWPDDPSCADATGVFSSELTFCSNGADEDGDGLVDWPEDPGCTTAAQWSEEDPACGLIGIEMLLAWPIGASVRRLRRRRLPCGA